MNQEKIFKFLWPNKCWHKEGFNYPYGKVCKYCGQDAVGDKWIDWEKPNPDFSTPGGMVMVLDRLKEMGYSYNIYNISTKAIGCKIRGFYASQKAFKIEVDADTLPLAVMSAMESLIRKEEEGE